MILLIDNYDSFTYNVVQRLGEINPEIDLQVHRNDQISIEQIEELSPSKIIISPGPCTPTEAGISVACADTFSGKVPILGICLGHQSIGQSFGCEIVRADRLMHGKTDMIHHNDDALFKGVENPFQATRYHSLVIKPDSLSNEFEMIAWSDNPETGEKEIMGIRHKEYPLWGLQFHPESFLTMGGIEILKNFIDF